MREEELMELPFGVKFTKWVNIIIIILNLIVSLLLAVTIIVPNFIRAVQRTGHQTTPIFILLIVGLISFIILSLPVAFLIPINKSLGFLNKKARIWQIVVSFLFIFVFPIGTILYGFVLYYMLFDKQTKQAFGV